MLTNEVRHELIRAVSDRVRMALSTKEGQADFKEWYLKTYGRPYHSEQSEQTEQTEQFEERKDETPCFTS